MVHGRLPRPYRWGLIELLTIKRSEPFTIEKDKADWSPLKIHRRMSERKISLNVAVCINARPSLAGCNRASTKRSQIRKADLGFAITRRKNLRFDPVDHAPSRRSAFSSTPAMMHIA
jgi:hypothetical protein